MIYFSKFNFDLDQNGDLEGIQYQCLILKKTQKNSILTYFYL